MKPFFSLLKDHLYPGEAETLPLPDAWRPYCLAPKNPAVRLTRCRTYLLLCRLLKEADFPTLPLHFTKFGKPYFAKEELAAAGLPPLFFSLSHEGSFGAAALSSSPVGVDLAAIVPIDDRHRRLAQRYSLDLASDERFAFSWATLEARAKCRPEGRGIADLSLDFSSLGIRSEVKEVKDPVTGERYALAVSFEDGQR